MDRNNEQPDHEERRGWKERPKYTTRVGGKNKDVSVKTPWSKKGRERYVQILNMLMEDRKADAAKGQESVEFEFMKEMRENGSKKMIREKKQKLSKVANDVVMPVWNIIEEDSNTVEPV